MMQKHTFLETEGNAWLERNRDKLGQDDEVTHVIAAHIGRQPQNVLEVGCSNGWRLAKLRDLYGCRVLGVDPSIAAGIEAAGKQVPVYQMTASCLPVPEKKFDLIIYAFCLYLTDPADWLLIASEGDRSLAAGGHIIIHDFGDFETPYATPYKHDSSISSWHFDFAKLWLSHPQYTMTHRHWTRPGTEPNPDRNAVTILRKNTSW